jgi:hypothetical protein
MTLIIDKSKRLTTRIPLPAIRRLVECLEPYARRNYESVRDTEDTARHLYHSVHAVSSWLDTLDTQL